MDKSNKRQTIIVAAAIAVSLYGLFNLGFSSSNAGRAPSLPDAQAQAAEVKAFAARAYAEILKAQPSAFDVYVIKQAGRAWGRDPFSGNIFTGSGTAGEPGPHPLFVYNGYVTRGGRKVAVIDNREYLAGQQLEKKGFFLKAISPSGVLIENDRGEAEFEIPISRFR
ncbi:MAG: hypothetical protein M0Z58_04500 [Nitrospiraceae bacterium]|nr:hypothetical protein [Nitrospiraceae bacterium]